MSELVLGVSSLIGTAGYGFRFSAENSLLKSFFWGFAWICRDSTVLVICQFGNLCSESGLVVNAGCQTLACMRYLTSLDSLSVMLVYLSDK